MAGYAATLRKRCAAAGAVVTQTNGDHLKVSTERGFVFVPLTPRGGRSRANIRALIRQRCGFDPGGL